ncbi:Protein disulfide isomerase-like 1-4 [Hibiscus syriacus]|uniref:protein disulfide-isomerase n=1 Tax=Hibiscus syriacus TaxID=106335 RepID=A0A6A3A9M9_HIBSY|nr:Protein disulfide isomerase-like 1-4 [Hibiscus syriacus]
MPCITTNDVEDDNDLRFLEEIEGKSVDSASIPDLSDSDDDRFPSDVDENGESEESENEQDSHDLDPDTYKIPVFDEKDVVVLTRFARPRSGYYVMVDFYAPWCGHSQAFAPEYAAAATDLKGEGVVLAKVDATEEDDPAEKEAILTWIKKNIEPGVFNVTNLDDAGRILTSRSIVVLGYLNSLVGPESDELAAASKLLDDISVYQTVNPDVAKHFHIEPQVKRPTLVLVKREAEKINHFDGQFVKTAISEFVISNKLPLVTTFNRDNAPSIFESSIKNHLLLFATLNISEKFIPIFQEAAKLFKGKLISIYVQVDNEDTGRPVANFFGVSGDGPRILAYSGTDARKFAMDGDVTLDNIKAFADEFLEDRLKPFYKSDTIPETNDEDVKVVVANSFNEIVLDESKDVLLEIYAPWCGHCRSLEPIYNKLAKHLKGIDSLVIAKMDGTTNEHPRARKAGFPTILFFPAGNKSSDPIKVNAERSVVAYYKFLKKHASIPFKLQKPFSTPKDEPASDHETKESDKSRSANTKDEL